MIHSVVRPRFVSTHTGDRLLLGDAVEEVIADHDTGTIEIDGDSGSGKSTAIKYLLQLVRDRPGIYFTEIRTNSDAPTSSAQNVVARFKVAPWTQDDCIEYLLSVRKADAPTISRCMSVADFDFLEGSPELCVIALNEMMANDSLSSFTDAITQHLISQTRNDLRDLPVAGDLVTFGTTLTHGEHKKELTPNVSRLLRQKPVRLIAAALRISRDLNGRKKFASLVQVVPKIGVPDHREVLYSLIADWIDLEGLRRLTEELASDSQKSIHPLLASIVAKKNQAWRPTPSSKPILHGAILRNMDWVGADLRRLRLTKADLSGSNLAGAMLTKSNAVGVRLNGVDLTSANMDGLHAVDATLTGADMTSATGIGAIFSWGDLSGVSARGACFRDAQFRNCKLKQADLREVQMWGVDLRDADLTDADLTGAELNRAVLNGVDFRNCILRDTVFTAAYLGGANLEDVALNQPHFFRSILPGANLTGASFVGGNFQHAIMIGCYMAEIDLSGADLRDADLSGSTFHMGSSRSGLVNSVIASEGTRTGFYDTDDQEACYREPEEYRVANLQGCDLRGASLENVDFWRVDLRGAVYDDVQHFHLKRTGAILD